MTEAEAQAKAALYSYDVLWSIEDEVFIGRVQEFSSLAAHGSNEAAALAEITKVVALVIEDCEATGESYPSPMNPGIRRTVAWLVGHKFDTIDSGDGQTADFGCDRPYPYVLIRAKPNNLVIRAMFLEDLLKEKGVEIVPVGHDHVSIQATFDPADMTAFIELTGVDDALLFGPKDA